MIITRRTALTGLGAGALWTTLAPGFAMAQVETERRFVFVFLRGGMDGLSAVPAYGDPNFASQRGALADGAPGDGTGFDARRLDDVFALNPDLAAMHDLYTSGEMLIVHATCHEYQDRSHFDAQDAFDRGALDKSLKSGWLNRTLAHLPTVWSDGRDFAAMGLGPTLAFSLRGASPVGTWSPATSPQASSDTIERLTRLYETDAVLGPILETGLAAQSIGGDMSSMSAQGFGPATDFIKYAKTAASFLKAPEGPRIVTIDYGNWDSHADQNARIVASERTGNYSGRFAEMYLGLDRGIAAMKADLGPDVWSKTTIMMVTEFGRTVKINGTRGTDHGTGGVAFLCGGTVNGGRVIADWPGLSDSALLEGRDLRPTTNLRALVKGVLYEHLGVGEEAVNSSILPESRGVEALQGLIRA